MTHPYLVRRDACPACTATGAATLFECGLDAPPIREHLAALYEPQGMIEPAYLSGGEFRVLECAQCGLVYHQDVPGDALMERLYEHWIDPARALAQHEAHVTLDTRMTFIREIVLAQSVVPLSGPRLRAFDFGMGWGDWCLMASAFGCDVAGAERSPSRLAQARRNGIEVVPWEEIPSRAFELINCDQVLEHVVDPLETLTYVARALAPRGLLKVSVPDGADLKQRLARAQWMAPEGSADSLLSITPLQHINCFHHAALVAMAARAGLRPAQIPLAQQMAATVDRFTPSALINGLTRPLGRRLLTRDTYLFLERAPG
jgi:2-polyprenyl-3-methyl-5-hydroxy-6-metoxy-1,4-benzoquinol methylase